MAFNRYLLIEPGAFWRPLIDRPAPFPTARVTSPEGALRSAAAVGAARDRPVPLGGRLPCEPLPSGCAAAARRAGGAQPFRVQNDQLGLRRQHHRGRLCPGPGRRLPAPRERPRAAAGVERGPPRSAARGHPAQPAHPRAVRGLRLTDGGIYDNMGLEPVWKGHRIVLVSDAGGLFTGEADRGLLWRLTRYQAIQERQSRALRKRWLISSFVLGAMQGTYWGAGGSRSRYGFEGGYSKEL